MIDRPALMECGYVQFGYTLLQCLGVGASGGSKLINQEANSAYTTAINQASQEFGDANAVFNDLVKSTAPIVAAGPEQTGFSAQQEAAINANTIDTTAAQYKNAATAVKSDIAGQGGGNIALPSGANIATEEALAEAGAQQTASGLRSNLQADYAAGNQNWQFASKAAEAAPEMFSTANSATQAATQAGSAASSTAQAINNAQNSWQQMAIAALGDASSVASAGLTSMGGSGGSGPTAQSWMPANAVPGQAYYPGGSGGSGGGSPSAPTGSSGLVGSVPGF